MRAAYCTVKELTSAFLNTSKNEARVLTLHVEEVDPATESVEQPHVDEDPCRVVLHVGGVLCAVVRVVPLVRGQQQLHERVREVGLTESLVVAGVGGNTCQGLQH